MTFQPIQVVTTLPDQDCAQRIANTLVADGLAACVQISGPITSVYRWQGAIETSQEWVCCAKTEQARFEAVEQAICRLHPYETPEIVALPIVAGSARYLAWLEESLVAEASASASYRNPPQRVRGMTPIQANDPKSVLAVGELLWDILPDGMQLGGAPFNFAYRVNSLGDCGVMASRVGQDELGDRALASVERLGVDTSLLQRDAEHPTGTVEVHFDADHQPDYFIVPDVAYDYLQLTPGLRQVAQSADCICFGTLVQRSETARRTVAELLDSAVTPLKVLDVNLRKACFSRQTVDESLARADLVKLNDDEVRGIASLLEWPCDGVLPLCHEIMARYPVRHCVVTFGAYGALVCPRDGRPVYEPGYQVDVVDAVGSGDAFTAGLIHRLLRGADLREACRFGNRLGAIVATQTGGTAPLAAGQMDDFETHQYARNGLREFEAYSAG